MANIGDAAFSQGDVMRRLHELERLIFGVGSGRGLESSTIGAGGLRIVDTGSVIVEAGGQIITYTENNGYVALRNGEINLLNGNFSNDVPGRIVAQSGVDRGVWIIPPRTVDEEIGDNWIFVLPSFGAGGTVGMQSTGTALITGDTGVSFVSAGGQILIDSGIGQTFITHLTTGSAANCVISTSGLIQRSTSSRRYKRDIKDYDVDPDMVLKLRPRTWRDKSEVERDPETNSRHIGFIAEELDELGLTEFIVYDEEGLPEAIEYDRLSAALIQVLKAQNGMLTALDERVSALENQESQSVIG